MSAMTRVMHLMPLLLTVPQLAAVPSRVPSVHVLRLLPPFAALQWLTA